MLTLHHPFRPQSRAFLPPPPSFIFELPVPRRALELPLRLSLGHILRGIEAGEMPPQNLLRTMAVSPFRPGVPVDDPALAIEHDDGVILHTVYHQPEPLFVLSVDGL